MSAATPQVTAPRTARAGGAGRVVLAVLGALLVLVGVGVAAGGGFSLWLHSQRDANGFVNTPTERFTARSYALTHDGVRLGEWPDWLVDVGSLGTVRVRARAGGEKPLFVGIADAAAVERYLAGVPHTLVEGVSWEPFSPTYRERPGSERVAAPLAQRFWVASSGGSRSESLTWKVREGDWALVVMNADGSRGIDADLSFGIRTGLFAWLGGGLLAGGAVLLALGGLALYLGVRTPPRPTPGEPVPAGGSVPAAGVAGTRRYPVQLEARLDEPLSRWLWLVKWLLALPHVVVLSLLWCASAVMWVVAFFAILFTGRYPRGVFDFQVGVLRWTWRVGAYAFTAISTDRYPPFTLDEVPDYPATLSVEYPGKLNRWLPLVKWLLVLPHALIVSVFFGWGWAGWSDHRTFWPLAGGLDGILVLIAGLALLFTARYPRELFGLVVGIHRWALRVVAYAWLLTDEYPPFRLDR